MRSFMVGAVLIVVLAILDTASAQRSTWRITPGKGYGPISLGQTMDDVRAVAGTPMKLPGINNSTDKVWSYPGFSIVFSDTDGTVVFIGIEDRSSLANGGVHVGSTIDQVVDVYGDTSNGLSRGQAQTPRCLDISVRSGGEWTLTFDYWNKGIDFQFSVGASPRVREIEVFPPRECPKIVY
jgi:hypothetical protein